MRLIDADALKEKIKEHHDLFVDAWGGFKNLPENDKARVDAYTSCVAELVNAPTIDAVLVVRCKDCVHAAPLEGYASRKFEIGLNCRACRGDSGYGITGLSFTVPDGYCDDGLRKCGEPHD